MQVTIDLTENELKKLQFVFNAENENDIQKIFHELIENISYRKSMSVEQFLKEQGCMDKIKGCRKGELK